eukprot:6150121-Ditylum_brightwellii.AAC.1
MEESECSFCSDNEISERLPLLSTSFYKIESHQILGRYGLSVVHGLCSSLPSPTVQDQHIIITTSSALQSASFYYSETSYSTVRRSQSSTTPPPTRQFSSLASYSTSGEVNIV